MRTWHCLGLALLTVLGATAATSASSVTWTSRNVASAAPSSAVAASRFRRLRPNTSSSQTESNRRVTRCGCRQAEQSAQAQMVTCALSVGLPRTHPALTH